MQRSQFEHVVTAVAQVAQETEIVVIGSQAILGAFPNAPAALTVSMEVDVYPLRDPGKSDDIDGALGDGSPFHDTFGFYAHGVGPETAKAPHGWQERLIKSPVPPRPGNQDGATALCLEPHDLMLSKCAAGRDRDWEFVRVAIEAELVLKATLMDRIDDLPVGDERKAHIRAMLEPM